MSGSPHGVLGGTNVPRGGNAVTCLRPGTSPALIGWARCGAACAAVRTVVIDPRSRAVRAVSRRLRVTARSYQPRRETASPENGGSAAAGLSFDGELGE